MSEVQTKATRPTTRLQAAAVGIIEHAHRLESAAKAVRATQGTDQEVYGVLKRRTLEVGMVLWEFMEAFNRDEFPELNGMIVGHEIAGNAHHGVPLLHLAWLGAMRDMDHICHGGRPAWEVVVTGMERIAKDLRSWVSEFVPEVE